VDRRPPARPVLSAAERQTRLETVKPERACKKLDFLRVASSRPKAPGDGLTHSQIAIAERRMEPPNAIPCVWAPLTLPPDAPIMRQFVSTTERSKSMETWNPGNGRIRYRGGRSHCCLLLFYNPRATNPRPGVLSS
jgi:hypothetical protein